MAVATFRLAVLLVALSACVPGAFAGVIPLLFVDFNQSGYETTQNQTGYQSFHNNGGVLHTGTSYSTPVGTVTVRSEDAQADGAPYFRAALTDTPPLTLAKLYSDFIYHNAGVFTMEISGLSASTQYLIKLYGYDSGLGGSFQVFTRFTPFSGSTGAAGSEAYWTNQLPTDNDFAATPVLPWTSDSSGKLTFRVQSWFNTMDTGPGAPARLNGFELYVPEPGSVLLLSLAGLAALRRRR